MTTSDDERPGRVPDNPNPIPFEEALKRMAKSRPKKRPAVKKDESKPEPPKAKG